MVLFSLILFIVSYNNIHRQISYFLTKKEVGSSKLGGFFTLGPGVGLIFFPPYSGQYLGGMGGHKWGLKTVGAIKGGKRPKCRGPFQKFFEKGGDKTLVGGTDTKGKKSRKGPMRGCWGEYCERE